MTQRIRLFLLFEAATFVLAAIVHFGYVLDGYEHQEARIAESAIAVVLLGGLLVSLARPAWTREAGLVAQACALVGTLIGLFTIAVGVGPRTVLDVVYHCAIIAVLIWGLLTAARWSGEEERLSA